MRSTFVSLHTHTHTHTHTHARTHARTHTHREKKGEKECLIYIMMIECLAVWTAMGKIRFSLTLLIMTVTLCMMAILNELYQLKTFPVTLTLFQGHGGLKRRRQISSSNCISRGKLLCHKIRTAFGLLFMYFMHGL